MKKSLLKSIVCIAVVFFAFALFNCVHAEEIIIDYSKECFNNDSKQLIASGDEFWVNISLKDILNTDSLSFFGELEYDKNVFEIVKSQENASYAEVKVGEKWSEATCEAENGNIIAHTQVGGNVDQVMAVKFRVKKDININESNITLKEISVRRNYIRNIDLQTKDLVLNIKIGKKLSTGLRILLIIGLVIMAIGIPVGLAYALRKIGNAKTKDVKKEEKK